MFRDNLLVSSSRITQSMKVGQIGCPEMSLITNLHCRMSQKSKHQDLISSFF